jgi:rhodanese-related sulfurtransferase
MDLGYTNVKAYEGGLEEWKNAGKRLERIEQASAA